MPETIEMGTMIPARRHLVSASWKSLAPNGPAVGAIFYRRLFEIDPNLRSMFSAVTMDDQIHKLVTMLDLVVDWLDLPERLVPVLEAGRAALDVRRQRGALREVRAALLGSLEEGLGDKFTPELRGAWTEAFFLFVAHATWRGEAQWGIPAGDEDRAGRTTPRKAAGADAA